MKKTKNQKNQRNYPFLLSHRTFAWVLIAACFMSLLFIRTHINNSITGDEPHYLIMTTSLVKDHDLNLKNNYQNNDSASFYPGLSPKFQVGSGQGENNTDRWYSIHGIGLPILLVPGVWLNGKDGAVLTMVIVATITIILLWHWVYAILHRRKYAYMAAFALVICFSFNGLAGYIYPDILVAGLALVALLIIERFTNNKTMLLVFGLIMGYLPLLHLKTIALCIPLMAIILYKIWAKTKRLAWETLIFFVPMLIYFFWSIHGWFGVWNPTHIYVSLGIPHVNPLMALSGIMFDSMRGFIIYNPVIILCLIGGPIWYKQNRQSFIIASIATIPSVLALVTFGGWQGGDSQIGRYVIDFLPITLPALGFAVMYLKKRWEKAVVLVLFIATLGLTTQSVIMKRPYVRSESRSPIFSAIQNHTGVALDKLLPTFDGKTQFSYAHGKERVLVGYLLLGGSVAYGYIISKNIKLSKQKSKKAQLKTN